MKLRKNTGPKALVLASTAGLFLGLLSLIRANPQLGVDAAPDATTESVPDYEQVFRSGFEQPVASNEGDASSTAPTVHTRTRGS